MTEISSSDFSDSISDEFEEIKKRADGEIISEEDKEFLNILVTIFISSVNNGDEYFQTTISLFCFIDLIS